MVSANKFLQFQNWIANFLRVLEEVCRNYVEHALFNRRPDWYEALMLPWIDDTSFAQKKFELTEKGEAYYLVKYESCEKKSNVLLLLT